jgi:Uma2 family endonuclease
MAEPAYDLHHDHSPWPKQGFWTWDDYLRLPDDGQRYEIIHGVLYVSPAPRYGHQFTCTRLAYFLTHYVLERDLGAVLAAPLDVLLPGVANPVQPDIVFLKNENLPHPDVQCFKGVPDLVVEVLSPATSRIDQHVKFGAYEKAGVREYWLVEPKLRTVLVYLLDASHEYRELGRFGAGESIRSQVLAGLEVKVSDLFPR